MRPGAGDHPANGELNGKKLRSLVDTGCSITVVQQRVAAKLKPMVGENATLVDPVLGRVQDPTILSLDRVKLGSATFLNQPATAESLAKVSGGQVLLGSDFLQRHFALLDCLDQRLYVPSQKLPVATRQVLDETLRRSRFSPVPLRRLPDLVYTLDALANGKPLRLLLDTGAAPWSI